MQAAGMLRDTSAICLFALLALLIGHAHSRQVLRNIPGYVPVYIRHGDEPLEDINPELADAFHESRVTKAVTTEQAVTHVDLSHESNKISEPAEKLSRKSEYPLRTRQAEGEKSAKAKDDDEPVEKYSDVIGIPKLLSPQELHNGKEKVTKDGHQGSLGRKIITKEPVYKLGPLSEEEKKDLEKLADQIKRNDTKLNEVHDETPNTPDISPEILQLTNNFRYFNPVGKLESPATKELMTERPLSYPIKDLSEVPDDTESKSIPESPEEEPPIKEQRPPEVLSNVAKISPIDLPEGNSTNNVSSKDNQTPAHDNKPKNPTKRDDSLTH